MEYSNKSTCPVGIEAAYGVKDAMVFGLNSLKTENRLTTDHPLQSALEKHAAKQEELEFQMLRKLQGIHAPLRIKMERMAVKDVGHLPCFHRHNALLDALTGNDKTMEFEDFLNCPRDVEVAGTPHMVIEKQLGML